MRPQRPSRRRQATTGRPSTTPSFPSQDSSQDNFAFTSTTIRTSYRNNNNNNKPTASSSRGGDIRPQALAHSARKLYTKHAADRDVMLAKRLVSLQNQKITQQRHYHQQQQRRPTTVATANVTGWLKLTDMALQKGTSRAQFHEIQQTQFDELLEQKDEKERQMMMYSKRSNSMKVELQSLKESYNILQLEHIRVKQELEECKEKLIKRNPIDISSREKDMRKLQNELNSITLLCKEWETLAKTREGTIEELKMEIENNNLFMNSKDIKYTTVETSVLAELQIIKQEYLEMKRIEAIRIGKQNSSNLVSELKLKSIYEAHETMKQELFCELKRQEEDSKNIETALLYKLKTYEQKVDHLTHQREHILKQLNGANEQLTYMTALRFELQKSENNYAAAKYELEMKQINFDKEKAKVEKEQVQTKLEQISIQDEIIQLRNTVIKLKNEVDIKRTIPKKQRVRVQWLRAFNYIWKNLYIKAQKELTIEQHLNTKAVKNVENFVHEWISSDDNSRLIIDPLELMKNGSIIRVLLLAHHSHDNNNDDNTQLYYDAHSILSKYLSLIRLPYNNDSFTQCLEAMNVIRSNMLNYIYGSTDNSALGELCIKQAKQQFSTFTPFIGCRFDSNNINRPTQISEIIPDSSCSSSNILVGDIIDSVNEKRTHKVTEIRSEIAQCIPGQQIKIRMTRKGMSISRDIVIGARNVSLRTVIDTKRIKAGDVHSSDMKNYVLNEHIIAKMEIEANTLQTIPKIILLYESNIEEMTSNTQSNNKSMNQVILGLCRQDGVFCHAVADDDNIDDDILCSEIQAKSMDQVIMIVVSNNANILYKLLEFIFSKRKIVLVVPDLIKNSLLKIIIEKAKEMNIAYYTCSEVHEATQNVINIVKRRYFLEDSV